MGTGALDLFLYTTVLGVWGRRPRKSCRPSGSLKLLPQAALFNPVVSFSFKGSEVNPELGALSPV